jgi:hypothetical protein
MVNTLFGDWGGSAEWWWLQLPPPNWGKAMTKLELLNAQKAEKFASICSLVAREFGYGELSTISEADRDQVNDEAEQHVELWGETVEMKTSPTIRPMTPLRRLLSEHQNLCERILDEREIEVGLWAYQRGAKKRKPQPVCF